MFSDTQARQTQVSLPNSSSRHHLVSTCYCEPNAPMNRQLWIDSVALAGPVPHFSLFTADRASRQTDIARRFPPAKSFAR